MTTLNSHTAHALADERVRELRQRHVGERPRYGPPAQRALAETKSKRAPTVHAKRRTDLSSALATAVRHLRRRIEPHQS